jgi:large repetitive protein
MSRNKVNQRRTLRKLAVESLETRRVLAGNVSAALSGYHLLITGDNLANDITITALPGTPGRVRITPAAGTTLNGLSVPLTFPSFGDIRLSMQGASDNVIFNGDAGLTDSLPGSLVVDNGEGNNTFTLSDYSIGTNLTVRSGSGVDAITLTNNIVGNNITINNGHANGFGRQTTNVETDNTIGGNLRISNLNGDHDINITGIGPIAVAHDLIIGNYGTGLGDDINIEIDNATVGNNFIMNNRSVSNTLINNLTVERNVTIRNSSGDNVVNLESGNTFGTSAADRFSLLNGIGSNTVDINDLTVNGHSSIRNYAGAANVTIGDDAAVTFNGALTINNGFGGIHSISISNTDIANGLFTYNGNGASNTTSLLGTVNVGGVSTLRNGNATGTNTFIVEAGTFEGLMTLINGTGASSTAFGSGGTVTAGNGITLYNGDGSTIAVDLINTNVTGALNIVNANAGGGGHAINLGHTSPSSATGAVNINTGTGNATVVIDELTVGGSLYVRTSSGIDTITLADDGATALQVTGNTYVDSGAGNDTILLADNSNIATFLGTLTIRAALGADNVTIGANVDNSAGTAIATGLFLFDGGADAVGSNLLTVNTVVIDPFSDPLTYNKFRNFNIVTLP